MPASIIHCSVRYTVARLMPAIFLADEIDEVVGAEMPLLPEEHIDDEIALAGALAAGRAHAIDVNGRMA